MYINCTLTHSEKKTNINFHTVLAKMYIYIEIKICKKKTTTSKNKHTYNNNNEATIRLT